MRKIALFLSLPILSFSIGINAAEFSSGFEGVKYYSTSNEFCSEGMILAREYYTISGVDLSDLVYTRVSENGTPYTSAVRFTSPDGYVAISFCASPGYKTTYRTRFARLSNTEQSNVLTYIFDASPAKVTGVKPEKLRKITAK